MGMRGSEGRIAEEDWRVGPEERIVEGTVAD
jgi:hypothetical protein